jgi:hypothetical protein
MNNEVTIDPNPDVALALETRKLSLEAGILGWFFGTGTQAPITITGFTLLLLTLGGLGTLFIDTKMPATEYWKIATPILTGGLGFLFGRKT